MKVTFLGTGTSTGIPEIGCKCEVCTSDDPRDRRLRSSVLVETEGKRLLIDCGPDFRMQMLLHSITSLDGVLITHEHYDHVGGLDDLRPFCRHKGVEIYAEKNVTEAIEARMPYAFREFKYPGIPNIELHPITLAPFYVAGIKVVPIRLIHGKLPIVGFRIGRFAYLTDLKYISDEEIQKLQGVDVLVINALRKEYHPTHQGVGEALTIIERIYPKKAWLIHMSHHVGLHKRIEQELPANVCYAYDGLTITC